MVMGKSVPGADDTLLDRFKMDLGVYEQYCSGSTCVFACFINPLSVAVSCFLIDLCFMLIVA